MNTNYIELARGEKLPKEEQEILQNSFNEIQQIREEIKEKLNGLLATTAIKIIDKVKMDIESDMKMYHIYSKDNPANDMVHPVTSWDFTN